MGKGVFRHKTDVKIFILFLLNTVRYPLTYADISDLVLSDGFVAEFDFTECFSQLCELGHIVENEMDGETCYLISPTGIEAAAELEGTIVSGLRMRSHQAATRLLSLRKRGARVSAVLTPAEGGRCTVTMKTEDAVGLLADVSLTFPTREEAEQVRAHFLEKPEEVLRGITAAATGELAYLLSSYQSGEDV